MKPGDLVSWCEWGNLEPCAAMYVLGMVLELIPGSYHAPRDMVKVLHPSRGMVIIDRADLMEPDKMAQVARVAAYLEKYLPI